jgi:hypothetical protein
MDALKRAFIVWLFLCLLILHSGRCSETPMAIALEAPHISIVQAIIS